MAMGGCRVFLGPDRMMRAADYSDESDLVFTVYYLCMAGGRGHPCRTAILSKRWETLRVNPPAVKQRWYCKICNAIYNTRFSMLLQISMQGVAYYCYAQMPPMHLFDSDGGILGGRDLALMTPESLRRVFSEL